MSPSFALPAGARRASGRAEIGEVDGFAVGLTGGGGEGAGDRAVGRQEVVFAYQQALLDSVEARRRQPAAPENARWPIVGVDLDRRGQRGGQPAQIVGAPRPPLDPNADA